MFPAQNVASTAALRAANVLRVLLLLALIACEPAFGGWVDPDSADAIKQTRSFVDNRKYKLVMSDEFNKEGRAFKDGADPMWTAIDRSDDSMAGPNLGSLHFYNSSYVRTKGGFLNITTTDEDTSWRGFNPYKKKYEKLQRHFRSGMVNTWNKFCFTGGIVEASFILPGAHNVSGLWPAFWLLGNLGRATYGASTNMLWPWSYDKCDRKKQKAQEISGCAVAHHYELNRHQGRGATEIDIMEVLAGPTSRLPNTNVTLPYNAMTLQVAPGIPDKRPPPGVRPEQGPFQWYKGLIYANGTDINPFFYGTFLGRTPGKEPIKRTVEQSYQADAIGSFKNITPDFFTHPHKYRLEWNLGDSPYLRWYMDDLLVFGVDEKSLALTGAHIPREPSYLIFNTAVSSTWGFPIPCPSGCDCKCLDCKNPACMCGIPPGFCKMLPSHFLVDWVRVYQDTNDTSQYLGCNPKAFPTTKWIEAYEHRYKNRDDKHPLKPITRGGSRCKDDSQCGEGACTNGKCVCSKGWVGPRCKVPNYKNDFKEEVVEVEADSMFVPAFLAWAGILLLASLIAAVGTVVLRRQRSGMRELRHPLL